LVKEDRPTHGDVVKTVCAISGERPPNIDPETGIAYGVICSNHRSLNPDAVSDITCNGDDLNYKAWKEEAKSKLEATCESAVNTAAEEFKARVRDLLAEASRTCDESVDWDELSSNLHAELFGPTDRVKAAVDTAVEYELDRLSESYESEGDFQWDVDGDGTLVVRHDAGNDIWVLKSPYYTLCHECSPCAPCAGYLTDQPGSVKAYCLPPDWFEDEKPTYPVWNRETGELVHMPPDLAEEYKEEK
jgi:hypothetical protein